MLCKLTFCCWNEVSFNGLFSFIVSFLPYLYVTKTTHKAIHSNLLNPYGRLEDCCKAIQLLGGSLTFWIQVSREAKTPIIVLKKLNYSYALHSVLRRVWISQLCIARRNESCGWKLCSSHFLSEFQVIAVQFFSSVPMTVGLKKAIWTTNYKRPSGWRKGGPSLCL